MAINANQLANEIAKQLRLYSDGVNESLETAAKDVSKNLVGELKTAGTFENRSGKYRKGWKTTKKTSRKGGVVYITHNNTRYRLTHLLEKGHVIKNGTGRTFGNSREFEHIKPAEETAIREYLERVERAIRQ